MSDTERDYKVGPGKPPLHSRFKKGQSGNGDPTKTEWPLPSHVIASGAHMHTMLCKGGAAPSLPVSHRDPRRAPFPRAAVYRLCEPRRLRKGV